MILWILLFSLLGSVFSMAGGVFLLWQEKLAKRFSLFLISFAAGVLLGVAFLDLLPESLEGFGDIVPVAWFALLAIVVFFTIERFLWWYHHHRLEAEEHPSEQSMNRNQAYLLLSGDAIHNFVDGVVIAVAFLSDINLGIAVSIGVIAHELPQEIADFGVMLSAGIKKSRVFLLNLGAALFTVVGAMLAFSAQSFVQGITPAILAFALGIFIYISLSDLIPEIHHRSEHEYDVLNFLFFIAGIGLIVIM